MKFFYLELTRNPAEISEVHEQNCPSIPPIVERTYLGPFNNSYEALRKAMEHKKNVKPCPICCKTKAPSVAFFSYASLQEH